MTCEEKRIQNNWTQKQYQECVQKNLPDLSEANEKAKEFNEDKEQGKIAGLVEKGIDKVKETVDAVELGLNILSGASESYDESNKLNNLKNIKITPESYAGSESDEFYNPDFLNTLGQNMSSNNINDLTDEENKIFSELGLQIAIDKNKENPNYVPTTMDIWNESRRLKILAAQDASGEKATILENLAGKNALTNAVSDLYRAAKSGYAQPKDLQTSLEIFESGNETQDKVLSNFLENQKETLISNEQSDEAKEFQKCLKENGNGFLGLGLCSIKNPRYITQVAVESTALNVGAVTQSQEVRNNAFGGAVSGVTAGSVIPGIGTATGAMSGMFYGVGSTLERGITFSELLIEATGIEDVSKITIEDLKKVLNDPEKLKDIQTKAKRRGQVIGGVSALSGGAAAKTTAALVKAGKGAKIAAAAGGTVEMIGEGTGEFLGQKAASQETNKEEIWLEMIGGLGTKVPISVGGTLLNLNQLSSNLQVRNQVKSNGFANMSDAFKPGVKTDKAQINISKIPNAEKTLNLNLEQQINNRAITPQEAQEIKVQFKETKAVVNQIKPLGLSTEKQSIVVDLLKEKKNLESTINQVNDESLTGKQSERVNEINKELKNVGEQETETSVTKESEGDIISEDTKIVEKSKREVASEKVQEIYDSKGREGSFEIIEQFKPIVNKIVQSRRDAPNFDAQLLTDEIETGKRGIIDLIDEYDASKGVPLAAFINKQLPLRAIESSKRVLGEKFTVDVTEARGVTDGTDINTQIQEDLDITPRTEKQKASVTKLRDIAGITTQEAQVGVTETLKTRLPGVTEKKFRQKVNEANRLKFGEKVLAEMGGLKDAGRLVTFLDTNFNDIIAAIPNSVKNKQLASLFKPKQVGRAKTAVGEGVFEYSAPTKQELIDFYTTGKNTTNRARVKTLADVIAQELALDATAEVLADPKVQKDFIAVQEIQGKETPKDTIPKLLEAIDRQIASLENVSDKYKGTLATGVTPAVVAKVVIAGLKIIKKGLQAGLTFQKALTRGLEYIKKNLKSEAAADIISSEIQNIDDLRSKTEKELETLMEDVQDAIDVELELGKQSVAYFKDLNSLNIKNTLDLSKFNFDISEGKLNEIKKKRLIKAKDKEQNDFINKGKDIVSAMPIEGKKLFIDGKNTTLLQGLLGFHYRYVGSGKASLLYDNISSKPAAWVSKRTKDLFAALPEKIITANDLKSIQIKINEAKSKAEKIQIAKNNIDKINQHKADVDAVYYANQSLLSDYVYSAKNELDLINKIDYVAKIKSTNSNNVNGDRALVKVNGFYIGPKGIKVKLEHVKTSSQQSIQGLEQILSGNIETSITEDFEGVYGFELDNEGGNNFGFSKIDKAGKTNTSQYYRFNNPVDAKNYILAEFNFDGTIADKNILSIVNDKKKADTTIKNGEQFVKNNPDVIPTVTDPAVLDKDINKIIEDSKGIKSRYKFSDIVAKRRGAGLKSFKIIPASAQDFSGLMYDLYGKGKKGEQQQKWVQNNLIKPYQKGIAEIDSYRQALKNDYSSLLKKFPQVAKKLGKTIPNTEFTFDQALRVNLWTKGGFEIPGLAKRDIKKLNDIIDKDIELKAFNEAALLISKQDKWIKPSAYWDSESLISDLNNLTNKVGRKQYLASFIENADVIFSNDNLNKMEVALGTNWREAMEDSLYRMKNGTNRPSGTNKLTNQFNNWVNNSVGAIMFFNVKSALLQTISSVNFLNWSDNNPYKAALAFGNQKQYWSDFSTLWNSPKLKQRRSGLRKDVNEAELANSVKGATNKAQAALSYLLKIGFTPTQMADSFAIASGGATFYRNRINTLKNQGLDQKAAEKQAFEDFAEASDVAQQSADPMLISQQQASPLGRLILAFQNTPAQVTRIFNKASRDFINNRGDQKTNISKMIYYGAVQGLIFATLQNAAFALIPGFDNEEDEEKKSKEFDKKEERILNSMADTMLRGSGVYGAIVSTLKNTALTYYREEKKDAFGKDHRNTLLEILNLSPPVGSKVRKINNAIKAKDYNKEVVKEQGWDVTLKGKVNLSPSYQVIASLTEAITNLPLERAVVEIDRVVEMLDARNTTFQRVALALGYRTWDVNTKNEERDLVKIESKEAKEKARKQKVIDDRAERKRLKELEKYKGKTKDEIKQMKRRDSIVDTNKSDQVKSLINLGLTKKEIKELKYEDDRVNKIIELTNK